MTSAPSSARAGELDHGEQVTVTGEMAKEPAGEAKGRSVMPRTRARDYFGAAQAQEAQAAVERGSAALAQFEAEALAAEAPGPAAGHRPGRRLRAAGEDEADR